MACRCPSAYPPAGVEPAGWQGRVAGIPWGAANSHTPWVKTGVLGVGGQFRKGVAGPRVEVPCSTPNSTCTMHDYTVRNCTDHELVNATDIVGAAQAAFGSGGGRPPVPHGSVIAGGLADEPEWTTTNLWIPTDTSPIVQARWVAYLQSQGMTPALLGFQGKCTSPSP